jgi:hypothetical protein
MSKAYELAKKYYPTYWDIDRIIILVKKGLLTEKEYKEITGYTYPKTK